MTDADLIYNALLRAERRIEEKADDKPKGSEERVTLLYILYAITVVREEVGTGLSADSR